MAVKLLETLDFLTFTKIKNEHLDLYARIMADEYLQGGLTVMTIDYKKEKYLLEIVKKPRHFGGSVYYFVCQSCKKMRAKLYVDKLKKDLFCHACSVGVYSGGVNKLGLHGKRILAKRYFLMAVESHQNKRYKQRNKEHSRASLYYTMLASNYLTKIKKLEAKHKMLKFTKALKKKIAVNNPQTVPIQSNKLKIKRVHKLYKICMERSKQSFFRTSQKK